jgi:hypothetical protein
VALWYNVEFKYRSIFREGFFGLPKEELDALAKPTITRYNSVVAFTEIRYASRKYPNQRSMHSAES